MAEPITKFRQSVLRYVNRLPGPVTLSKCTERHAIVENRTASARNTWRRTHAQARHGANDSSAHPSCSRTFAVRRTLAFASPRASAPVRRFTCRSGTRSTQSARLHGRRVESGVRGIQVRGAIPRRQSVADAAGRDSLQDIEFVAREVRVAIDDHTGQSPPHPAQHHARLAQLQREAFLECDRGRAACQGGTRTGSPVSTAAHAGELIGDFVRRTDQAHAAE